MATAPGTRVRAGGLPQGRGTYWFPDGSRFEGSFERGLARASGAVVTPDGRRTKAEIVDASCDYSNPCGGPRFPLQGPAARLAAVMPRSPQRCGACDSPGSTWMVTAARASAASSDASIRSHSRCDSATVIAPGTVR